MSAITRVKLVPNKHYKASGLKSLIKAYNKYNIIPTKPGPFKAALQDSHGRLHKFQSGGAPGHSVRLARYAADGTAHQVSADDQQNDTYYTIPVQVGTPSQTLNLDLDSGSSDFWVWSNKLPSNIQSQGQKAGIAIFDSSKSSTFKDMSGSTWQIQYGDGSGASGVVGTDTVKLGDITIQAQAVELANKLSSSFESEVSSGLCGMAFGSINTVKPQPVKTPLENMIAQQDIPTDMELFTCYLGSIKDVNDPDHGQSFYTFGSIDQSIVQASGQEIGWAPVDNSQGFWMFDSPYVTVQGQKLSGSATKAIADTGTTLWLTSDATVEAIYGAIDGAKYDEQLQGYLIPTLTDASSRPKITIAVGDNKEIIIEQEQLALTPVEGTNMSYGAIQSRGNMTFDICGDTFLVCCYAIFDAGNTRFGCVQRPDPTPAGGN